MSKRGQPTPLAVRRRAAAVAGQRSRWTVDPLALAGLLCTARVSVPPAGRALWIRTAKGDSRSPGEQSTSRTLGQGRSKGNGSGHVEHLSPGNARVADLHFLKAIGRPRGLARHESAVPFPGDGREQIGSGHRPAIRGRDRVARLTGTAGDKAGDSNTTPDAGREGSREPGCHGDVSTSSRAVRPGQLPFPEISNRNTSQLSGRTTATSAQADFRRGSPPRSQAAAQGGIDPHLFPVPGGCRNASASQTIWQHGSLAFVARSPGQWPGNSSAQASQDRGSTPSRTSSSGTRARRNSPRAGTL